MFLFIKKWTSEKHPSLSSCGNKMTRNCKDHFTQLNDKLSSIIMESFSSDLNTRIVETFQLSEDMCVWRDILNEITDTSILVSAIQEFEFGLQAALSGQYRYAFTAQRYFLEQICRFIYLSTNELHLRHWKLGLRDISWSSLIDNENGIFSKVFIRAFFPEVEDEGEHMIAISGKLYRESSEFIHGNSSKIEILPKLISFDRALLEKWIDFMETSRFITQFLMFMRFSKDIDTTSRYKLENIAKEELGGIEEFNALF
ncbi:hypothetical protein [Aeromonas hydrophila]|uniref:hypothetical protein n=2 Tax=Aeromonas TaxID=642 RepID=UPI002B466B6F|nr:hypothetical protein [Aeromonas hydrophila]